MNDKAVMIMKYAAIMKRQGATSGTEVSRSLVIY